MYYADVSPGCIVQGKNTLESTYSKYKYTFLVDQVHYGDGFASRVCIVLGKVFAQALHSICTIVHLVK